MGAAEDGVLVDSRRPTVEAINRGEDIEVDIGEGEEVGTRRTKEYSCSWFLY